MEEMLVEIELEAVGVRVWESVVTLAELCKAAPWVEVRPEVKKLAGLAC